jgi:hypothetical protein
VTIFYTGSRAGPTAPPPSASPLWTLGACGPGIRRGERLARLEHEQRVHVLRQCVKGSGLRPCIRRDVV